MDKDGVSAVICTRDRCKYLLGCLKALEKQTLSRQAFEVIVVDNGSTDDTRAIAQSFTSKYANFRYIHEERAGLAIARNTGIRHAQTDIIAFTDDDAEPDPTWLERILARFRQHGEQVGIVGGDVIPLWETPRPQWLNDLLLRPLSAGLHWGTEARFLRSGEWLVEVNSAYSRAALERAGGFPEHLGRVGSTLLSGEGGVNVLIERMGLRLFYDPAILVRHHIPASRLTQGWFRRRAFWQGISLNLLNRYLEETTEALGLPEPADHGRRWEEIPVPASPSEWAALFEERTPLELGDQLYRLEQLGYLLESQAVVIGR